MRSPATVLALSVTALLLAQPVHAQEWTELFSYAGNGMSNSESFQVTEREWRVRWDVPAGAEGLLQIYVYDEGETLVALAANQTDPQDGTSIVRGDPGRYYFEVISYGFDWEVIAEVRP